MSANNCMVCNSVTLKTVLADYGHTRPMKEKGVRLDGIHLEFAEITPIVAAYRRMIRDLEFDICELAAVTYLAAREAGIPITALPLPLNRNFHHGDIVCRPGSGIRTPKDLEGRKIGVRAYSVTTGVWIRGILSEEFGVDLNRITWVVDDEEHVDGLKLPENVERVPAGGSLSNLFREGGIDAAFKGAAGIGRAGAAAENWEQGAVSGSEYYDLISDPSELAAASYRNTHIYPLHGIAVIRNDVISRYPWLPKALYRTFGAVKEAFLSRTVSTGNEHDERHLRFRRIVGSDPLPYGIGANRETFEALIRYCLEQKILLKKVTPEELFIPLEESI